MKTLFFALSLSLLSLTASVKVFAAGGSPPTPSYGGMSCSASDKGYEEHWGGHSSCSECQIKHHGSCTERCNRDEFNCTAEGTRSDGSTDSVTAFDEREMYARDRALERCYNLRMSACRVSSCTNSPVEVSSRSCQ